MTRTTYSAALALLLAMPAAAQDASTEVASVNGAPIALGEVLTLYESMGGELLSEGMEEQAIWDMIIEQLAQQEALAQQIGDNPGARDLAAITLSRRAFLASSVLEKIAIPDPSEEELQAAYSEAFSDIEPVREYNAAHILMETKEGIDTAKAELDAGKDFAEVARERSTDSSGQNGGDLDWFTLDMMVQPFAEQVEALEAGAVSEPFESQFGWHIAKLIDTRLQEPPAFEEVRSQLETLVRRQRVEKAADAALENVKVERNPDLGPDLLTRSDLLEN